MIHLGFDFIELGAALWLAMKIVRQVRFGLAEFMSYLEEGERQ